MTEPGQTDLFQGAHVPAIRLEAALEALDFERAMENAPPEWRPALADLARAVEGRSPGRADLEALVAARCSGWPAVMERTWHRLVGRALDGRGIPGVHEGEPAAAWLLRGGERERAHASIERHLRHHPADPAGWRVMAEFDSVWGAVRCAFHGGPVLPGAEEVSEAVEEDELEPVAPWILPYAWLLGIVDLPMVEEALGAEGIATGGPLPLPGDARAFTLNLVAAERGRLAAGTPNRDAIEARRRLRQSHPAAFARYLRRVG